MDLQLKDKVIVVTGGASGIGAAIVTGAAREGAVAVIADKCAEAAHEVECNVKKSGGQAHSIVADLMSVEACRRVIEETLDRCGRLDALVNNAGLNDGVGLENGSPEAYVKSIERNLLHYYNLAHYALPSLKHARGSIVNIASKTAVTGQGGTSGYASSKGAILALTREWAIELLPYEIRVNAVLPAEVWTPMYESWIAEVPGAGSEAQGSGIPYSPRQAHDHAGRNRSHGAVPDVEPGRPHHRPTPLCGWRLRAS